ncbi:hypothetical protein ABZX62_12855 [Streptomyces flavidovirens]|uniref:hypothetical protein n=1 Tax=Streptomyces flavidovirens TaxID=67298 RepID=UPI0033B5A525
MQWTNQPLAGTREDTETRHAEVALKIGGTVSTALFAEALWSEKFASLGRPSMRRTLAFLLASLPLLFWIIGPDHRDLQALDSPPVTWRGALRNGLTKAGQTITAPVSSLAAPETRSMGRLLWRVMTLTVLVWMVVYSTALALGGSVGFSVLLLILLGSLVWLARSHKNVIWHVRVAATDEERTEQLLTHLHQKLRWMEKHCDEVTVVAHSQGGYLMHRVLSPDSGHKHPKVRRFIGVGSGLKPITLLKAFARPDLKAAVWLAVLAMPLTLWGIGPLTWKLFGPELSALLRSCYMTLHATVMPAALASDPEVVRLWWTGVATELWQLATVIAAGFRLDLAHTAAIVGGLSMSWLAGSVAHAALRAQPSAAFSLDHQRRGIEWREYTSPHDMVGRMLGPGVPEGVDQPWVSATGQPVADHILYFHHTGVLPRRLAADLLRDLSTRTPENALLRTAEAWDRTVVAFDHTRRQQAARRRMLHGLLLGLVTALLMAPALYRHTSLSRALLGSSLLLAIVLSALAGLFTWIAHRSAGASADDFTARMTGTGFVGTKPWRVRIVPPGLRTAPAFAAAMGGVVSLFGLVWFTKVAIRYGDDRVWFGYPLLLPLSVGLLMLACAIAAGYPVRKRWPTLLTVTSLLALWCPPAERAAGMPWDLRAEVTLSLCVTLCALISLLGALHARRKISDRGPRGPRQAESEVKG